MIPKTMGLGLGMDWKPAGKSIENGDEFANGGGQDLTASLTLQGRLPGDLMASLGLRYPVWREVVGTQGSRPKRLWRDRLPVRRQ